MGFCGETEADFEQTLALLDEVQFDGVFTFKYSPRPNTPSLALDDAIPDEEKSRRLMILMERQREIQRHLNKRQIGHILEVMVEARNEARQQWIARTSQNKTLNFSAADGIELLPGSYVQAEVTEIFPNSLVGRLVI